MTIRLPRLSAVASPRRRVPALVALVCALALGACAGGKASAPSGPQPLTPSGQPPAATSRTPVSEPVVDESFSIRLDPALYQLEEAITLIARSLSKVQDRTPTLAINSFYFGKEVSADFRRKAEVVILDKLFQVNPNVRLVQCQECQKLQTQIQRGVLKLRKGIPSQEARKALADKLDVDGFVDIGMFTTDGQVTVYLKVVEANSGAIILVDELAGRRAPKRDALTFGFGEMIFPISSDTSASVNHKALVLSVQEAVKLTGRFSFGVDVAFYLDNNDNNPDKLLTLNSGILLAPTLGFDILQVPASTSRLIAFVGIGKLISPQLDYANLARLGVEMVVGDQLSVMFAFNDFLKANITGTDSPVLSGAGYDLRFGYRF